MKNAFGFIGVRALASAEAPTAVRLALLMDVMKMHRALLIAVASRAFFRSGIPIIDE